MTGLLSQSLFFSAILAAGALVVVLIAGPARPQTAVLWILGLTMFGTAVLHGRRLTGAARHAVLAAGAVGPTGAVIGSTHSVMGGLAAALIALLMAYVLVVVLSRAQPRP